MTAISPLRFTGTLTRVRSWVDRAQHQVILQRDFLGAAESLRLAQEEVARAQALVQKAARSAK